MVPNTRCCHYWQLEKEPARATQIWYKCNNSSSPGPKFKNPSATRWRAWPRHHAMSSSQHGEDTCVGSKWLTRYLPKQRAQPCTDFMVHRHYSQRSHSGSPVCCRRSRTSQRSIPTTQPASARAEHARATRLQQAAAATGAQRAPVPHMHPCPHKARQCFPWPRPTRVHPGSSSAADQHTRAASEALRL